MGDDSEVTRFLEWVAAVEQHNRLLRGLVSGLGLTTLGLVIYVIGSALRGCHG